MKRVLVITLALVVVFAFAGCGRQAGSDSGESISAVNDMGLSSGSYQGISFEPSEYALNKTNGKYVMFQVKNNGKTDIRISINEYKEMTLQPDKEGCVWEEFSKEQQKFTFKVVPTQNGGEISIDYKMQQSNTME